MKILTRLALLQFALIAPALSLAATPSLDQWIQNSLVPELSVHIDSHPRFRGETLRFVVLDDGQPAAISNELSIAVRDKLRDEIIDRTDARIAWQAGLDKFSRNSESSRIDCTASEAQYYIGIEISEAKPGRHRLEIRVLDVVEQTWVSGAGYSWQGSLTAMQQRALRTPDTDNAWLGQRVVPFESSQTDLLAEQLAIGSQVVVHKIEHVVGAFGSRLAKLRDVLTGCFAQ